MVGAASVEAGAECVDEADDAACEDVAADEEGAAVLAGIELDAGGTVGATVGDTEEAGEVECPCVLAAVTELEGTVLAGVVDLAVLRAEVEAGVDVGFAVEDVFLLVEGTVAFAVEEDPTLVAGVFEVPAAPDAD